MSREDPNILEAHEQDLLEEERQALRPWSWTARGFFLLGIFLLATVVSAQAILIIPASIAPKPVLALQNTIRSVFPFSLLPRISGTVLAGENADRVNVLVTGIGGAGHDGPYLTDTILLGSYQPSTNTVALLSIPRDLFVPGVGPAGSKINAIGATQEVQTPGAGIVALKDELEKLFNLPIPYYLRVDFRGFEQLVDRIGGIDVLVERSFEDQQYPIIGNEKNKILAERYEILKIEKGSNHFDGTTALKFARSRYGNNGEGSDFARMHRQQKVIAAVKEKLMSPSLLRPRSIGALSTLLREHITTNISFPDVFRFQDILNKDPKILASSIELEDGILQETRGLDGAYLLEPKSSDYGLLKTLAATLFERSRPVVSVAAARVEVLNGTKSFGLGATVGELLVAQGIAVENIGNAAVSEPPKTTTLYDLTGKHRKQRDQIAKHLSASIATDPPSWLENSNKFDCVVVLGEDAAARFAGRQATLSP